MIEEHLVKLCRIWGEDSLLPVHVSENPNEFMVRYTHSKEALGVCLLPEILEVFISTHVRGYEYGSLENFRACRYGTWHESMHVIHTPPKLAERVGMLKLNQHAVNIIEDYRIEYHGLKKYKGYVGEKEFIYKVKFRSMMVDYEVKQSLRESKIINNPEDWDEKLPLNNRMKQKLFEILLNWISERIHLKDSGMIGCQDSMIMGYPHPFKPYKHRLERVIKDIHNVVEYDKDGMKCLDRAEILTNILDDICDEHEIKFPGGTPQFIQSGGEGTITNTNHVDTRVIEETSQEIPANEIILREYSEKSGLNDDGEFEGVDGLNSEAKAELDEINEMGYMVLKTPQNNLNIYNKLKADSVRIKAELQQTIKQIRKEWMEVERDEGDELDVDGYLTNSRNPWITDDKNKPINKVLFLIDLSQSVTRTLPKYKMSLIQCMESMDSLGLSYGVYGFNERGSNEHAAIKRLYHVKTLGELDNQTVHERVGGLQSNGYTPIASLLKEMKGVLHKYRAVILLTDGCSTEPEKDTKQMFMEYQRMGVDLYIIAYVDDLHPENERAMSQYFNRVLHPRQKRKYKLIKNIMEFPGTVLKLVRG